MLWIISILLNSTSSIFEEKKPFEKSLFLIPLLWKVIKYCYNNKFYFVHPFIILSLIKRLEKGTVSEKIAGAGDMISVGTLQSSGARHQTTSSPNFSLLNFIFSAKAVKKEVHFVSLREALFGFIGRQNLVLLLLFVGRRTP